MLQSLTRLVNLFFAVCCMPFSFPRKWKRYTSAILMTGFFILVFSRSERFVTVDLNVKKIQMLTSFRKVKKIIFVCRLKMTLSINRSTLLKNHFLVNWFRSRPGLLSTLAWYSCSSVMTLTPRQSKSPLRIFKNQFSLLLRSFSLIR